MIKKTKENIGMAMAILCCLYEEHKKTVIVGAGLLALLFVTQSKSVAVYEVVTPEVYFQASTIETTDNPERGFQNEPQPEPVVPSRGSTSARTTVNDFVYSSFTVESTAYWAGSCDKSPSHPAYGITKTGTRVGFGQIAVDPNVIPLGSRVYIEEYGYAIATDTGGDIKGNRVDLCFETEAECFKWGRQDVIVYILP